MHSGQQIKQAYQHFKKTLKEKGENAFHIVFLLTSKAITKLHSILVQIPLSLCRSQIMLMPAWTACMKRPLP